eukprot:7014204-Prymnesium_polylepis.2
MTERKPRTGPPTPCVTLAAIMLPSARLSVEAAEPTLKASTCGRPLMTNGRSNARANEPCSRRRRR